MTRNDIEKAGTGAVRALRIAKLGRGVPFMINDPELPSNQCYLEYPDGKIVLVTLIKYSRDLTPIRVLTDSENQRIRAKYNLPISHA